MPDSIRQTAMHAHVLASVESFFKKTANKHGTIKPKFILCPGNGHCIVLFKGMSGYEIDNE